MPLSSNRWRLLSFIMILVMMGLVRQPVVEHFRQAKAGEVDTRVPAIRDFGLSLVDFEQIMRYLHFANNHDLDEKDKAAKVRPMLELFRQACMKSWTPGRHAAVDEMMIRFKGRLGWRQYMRDKPIKFGLKIWGLCQSAVGYLMNFDLYTGRKPGGRPEKGLAQRVVLQLVGQLLEVWPSWQGAHLYMDNFYTSLTLLLSLWSIGVAACGTLRAKRKGMPDLDVNDDKGDRDDYDWKVLSNHKSKVIVGAWQDNKLTRFATTIHGRGRVEHTRMQGKSKGGGEVTVQKPLAVKAYTKYMDGCDVADQRRSYYDIRVKVGG